MSNSFALDSEEPSFRRGFMPWLVCLSAGLFFFYEFFQLNLFDVINQSLRADFKIDAAQLSWMSSTYIWANVLFLLPAGVILDRLSTRRVILLAMAVCVLGTMGFALTHSFAMAAFFHSLTGIGNAFCFLSCVVLVSRWFPPRRQALVIGCIVTMAFIGGTMAHTPLAYLSSHYGWRQALLMDAAVGALLLGWIALIVRDTPIKTVVTSCASATPQASFNLLAVLSNRQNWFAGVYTACLNLPIMVLCALWGASYLHVVHHLTPIQSSNVVSLIFLGSIVGCPLVGWLSDSMGRRKPLMLIGAIATLLTVTPLFLSLHLSVSLLSILFFALGFFSSTQVIAYPLIAESNPSQFTGVATGIASIIIMGGGGVGQLLFGLLMRGRAGDAAQQYAAMDFQLAMWMFPIASLVAIFVIFLTRETWCVSLK